MEQKNISQPFLDIKDLVVEYTSDGEVVHAVNGVSLHLHKGRTLGLVGETGAGKTSIAKSIMRILPDPPAKIRKGEICIEGQDVLKLSEAKLQKLRGHKVSMIFQDPMTALNPVKKVVDQIAEGIKLHQKVSTAEAIAKAIQMLKMVGIAEDRVREYPHQFSGGMKQRVVIAMALACSPELLLADEPTTALDVTIQAQVLTMINKLKTEFDMAMVMITHDLGVVAEVCDDVAIIYAGEIVEYGSKEEIFDYPSHPYTKGLFAALPNLSHRTRRLHPVEGLPPDPTNLPRGCKFNPRCPMASEECKGDDIGMVKLNQDTHHCRCIKVKELVNVGSC